MWADGLQIIKADKDHPISKEVKTQDAATANKLPLCSLETNVSALHGANKRCYMDVDMVL